MLGEIEIPLWAITTMLFVWLLPVVASGTVFFFGKRLGKYRILTSIVVLVLGLLFIEDLVELIF